MYVHCKEIQTFLLTFWKYVWFLSRELTNVEKNSIAEKYFDSLIKLVHMTVAN